MRCYTNFHKILPNLLLTKWFVDKFGRFRGTFSMLTRSDGIRKKQRSASHRMDHLRKMSIYWPPLSLSLSLSRLIYLCPSYSLPFLLSSLLTFFPRTFPPRYRFENRRATGIPPWTRNAIRTRGRWDGEPIERRERTLNEGQSDREREMRTLPLSE